LTTWSSHSPIKLHGYVRKYQKLRMDFYSGKTLHSLFVPALLRVGTISWYVPKSNGRF
jgi:hypothetical protein